MGCQNCLANQIGGSSGTTGSLIKCGMQALRLMHQAALARRHTCPVHSTMRHRAHSDRVIALLARCLHPQVITSRCCAPSRPMRRPPILT